MRRLLKGPPEHNWGLSIASYIGNIRTPEGNWTNDRFHSVRGRADYQFVEEEWAMQREFCHPLPSYSYLQRRVEPDSREEALIWDAFVGELEMRLDCIRRGMPMPDDPQFPEDGVNVVRVDGLGSMNESAGERLWMGGRKEMSTSGNPAIRSGSSDHSFEQVTCGNFDVGLSSNDGAVVYFKDTSTGRVWASNESTPLGRLVYRTYNMDDFNRFNMQYNPNCGPPCDDFSKTGMQAALPESRLWSAQLQSLMLVREITEAPDSKWHGKMTRNSKANVNCSFKATLSFPSEAHTKYGAAETYTVELRVPGLQNGAAMDLTVSWRNKTASRLAEALFFSFTPVLIGGDGAWTMDVLGYGVSPLDVVANGTRHVHAVWDGVGFSDMGQGGRRLWVRSLDAALVCPGDTNHLLWYDGDAQPHMAGGMHYNLHNNLWGTAFPQWYGDHGRFRFQVYIK